jgi:pyruvate-formate lyase-activating enzyme
MSSALAEKPRLDPSKFRDPRTTAKGERRAQVALKHLRTLWFNTGTLCNLTCRNCYIESSPSNDRLVYLTAAEVRAYLDEIERDGLGTDEIGFTGGEPFMNPDLGVMLQDCLSRGFRVLVLTNAMKPMMKVTAPLLAAKQQGGERLIVRVSIDHYTKDIHELERGKRSWAPTVAGLRWLVQNGFHVHVATRSFSGQTVAEIRRGFARLFAAEAVPIDADDPVRLTVFPEMDTTVDVPEITEACWGILKKSPDAMMCATSRMVVKRRDADVPAVVACTLLPYDPQFELGTTLAEASRAVPLNHPHCAKFCVLGGGACSR